MEKNVDPLCPSSDIYRCNSKISRYSLFCACLADRACGMIRYSRSPDETSWLPRVFPSGSSFRFLPPVKNHASFPITGVSYEIRKSRIFLQVSVRWKASSFVAFYWYLVFYDFVNKSDGGEKTESKRFLGRFSETDIEFFGTCEYPFPLLFGSNFLKNQTLSAKDEFYVFFT